MAGPHPSASSSTPKNVLRPALPKNPAAPHPLQRLAQGKAEKQVRADRLKPGSEMTEMPGATATGVCSQLRIGQFGWRPKVT